MLPAMFPPSHRSRAAREPAERKLSAERAPSECVTEAFKIVTKLWNELTLHSTLHAHDIEVRVGAVARHEL